MQRALLRAELEHVAEEGDAAAARDPAEAVLGAGAGKDLERRGHRLGAGVVALVDQGDRAVEAGGPEQHPPARAAAVGRRPLPERQRGAGDVAAERVHRREHPERVHRQVPARHAEAVEERRAADPGGGRGSGLADLHRVEAELGPADGPEADQPAPARRAAAASTR